jgi:glycerol-3-phosphate dehydrogenase
MPEKLKQIQNKLNKLFPGRIYCREWHSSIVLEGTADNWDDVVLAGKLSANRGYKGVVNRIEVPDLLIPPVKIPPLRDKCLEKRIFDVLIIGGGIIGCAIARELSKWNISILLVDKEADLAMHASSRNDGMVHPGFEPKPGSKKAIFNVRGNKLYEKIAKELDVPFRRSGSIILFDRKWLNIITPLVVNRARRNNVCGVRFISADEILKREPWVNNDITGGIYIPSTAFISPYKTTVAYAENAVTNGVEVSLNTIVLSMEKEHGKIVCANTNRGKIYPYVVINAAGTYSDKIADMAGDQFFTIHPRKGHLVFFDKKKQHLLNSVVAKPDLTTVKSNSKGGGLVKTVDGNILAGPDAVEQPFREDFTTECESIKAILHRHLPLIPSLSAADIITYCAGVRASTYEEDFIIEASEYVENLVHAAGIQSPGLASAPAIAEEIEKITLELISKIKPVKPKPNWNPCRKGIPELNRMSTAERNELIRKCPDYGRIICRCEEISAGEIIDAIRSPVPATTVDGIKRRVRAGMGRCQGGFCLPSVIRIMHEELGQSMCEITKKGHGSNILTEETKQKKASLKQSSG